MRFGWLAAAAALVCTGPAGATTFVEYEVSGSGYYSSPFTSPTTYIPIQFVYDFVVEVDPNYSSPTTMQVGTGSFFSAQTGPQMVTATITSPGVLSFYEASIVGAIPTTLSVNFSTAGNPNVFPTTLTTNDASGNAFIDRAGKFTGGQSAGSISQFRVLGTVPDFSFPTLTDYLPEPATWAMMILGVGAIGAAARRTRKRDNAALA